MEIRGYSSWNDNIIGLRPSGTTREEVQRLSDDGHLVVRVQEQDPSLRQIEDYLGGKVPERGSRISELINKMVF